MGAKQTLRVALDRGDGRVATPPGHRGSKGADLARSEKIVQGSEVIVGSFQASLQGTSSSSEQGQYEAIVT